ncbi:MAG: class I SAM-dependent methyltransferase [Parerythrobacter sp.]
MTASERATISASASTSALFRKAREGIAIAERTFAVPNRLRERWTVESMNTHPEDTGAVDRSGRLQRFRTEVVPWMDRTRSLRAARILEIGCGEGASTVTLAEQGANVLGLDVDQTALAIAARRCAAHGVDARFEVGNAEGLASHAAAHAAEWIVFWAVLEHMTDDERLASLSAAWEALPDNGLMTVIETPNRLWHFDSHTAQLPFYHWLPEQLAYNYASRSPRKDFRNGYTEKKPSDTQLAEFRRRGRGVSYHEFEVAIGRPVTRMEVASCMQLERRGFNPARSAGWTMSASGRYERALRRVAPDIPRAWFQPFLYLTLRKSTKR